MQTFMIAQLVFVQYLNTVTLPSPKDLMVMISDEKRGKPQT